MTTNALSITSLIPLFIFGPHLYRQQAYKLDWDLDPILFA